MIIMEAKKKLILRVILIIGILAGSFVLIFKLNVPKVIMEEKILQEGTIETAISYEVYLKENDLFDDLVQAEGGQYIKNIIDYIRIDFNTGYKVSELSDIKLEYDLFASMIGFSSSKDSRTDYWTKKFPLIEKKVIQKKAQELQGKEEIKFYLGKYDEFAKMADDLIGMNLSTELVFHMVGTITANTSAGMLNSPFDIQLTIPMNENIFSITKGALDPITNQITQTNEVTQPIQRSLFVALGVGIAIFLLILILSFFLIEEPSEWVLIQKATHRIIKNSGSRMVALRYRSDKEYMHRYEVNSIKDLLIVSDETQNPIYYFIDEENEVENNTFYVENSGDIYIYKQRIRQRSKQHGGTAGEKHDFCNEVTLEAEN